MNQNVRVNQWRPTGTSFTGTCPGQVCNYMAPVRHSGGHVHLMLGLQNAIVANPCAAPASVHFGADPTTGEPLDLTTIPAESGDLVTGFIADTGHPAEVQISFGDLPDRAMSVSPEGDEPIPVVIPASYCP
jgi:hypothetical protein